MLFFVFQSSLLPIYFPEKNFLVTSTAKLRRWHLLEPGSVQLLSDCGSYSFTTFVLNKESKTVKIRKLRSRAFISVSTTVWNNRIHLYLMWTLTYVLYANMEEEGPATMEQLACFAFTFGELSYSQLTVSLWPCSLGTKCGRWKNGFPSKCELNWPAENLYFNPIQHLWEEALSLSQTLLEKLVAF